MEEKDARLLVEQKILESDGEIVVTSVKEEEFGWVYFIEFREYIESGNDLHKMLGHGPIIVLRKDGSLHETGSAYPLEHYLRKFRKKWWRFW